jgi:hypothetical protein
LLAERFCSFVESSGTLNLNELVQGASEFIVALYAAALQLPSPEPTERDAPEAMTHAEWNALHRRLAEQFGQINSYSFFFDPYETDSQPVTASLADDLADIYRYLRTGLMLYGVPDSRNDAIWGWRFGFEDHWGRHAAHALYALHNATY